jgi:hypothetical protein
MPLYGVAAAIPHRYSGLGICMNEWQDGISVAHKRRQIGNEHTGHG